MLLQLDYRISEEILSDIEIIESDEKLYREKNFIARSQAIDHIEFHIIDRIDALTEGRESVNQLIFLKQNAKKIKFRLEEVDIRMFQQLRAKISQEGYRGKLLMDLFEEYLDDELNTIPQKDAIGYDSLDTFLNGLLTGHNLPVETKDREPEMVYYQKTPARIILELIRKAEFKPEDVFFDLGSGLGQVAILVNLLSSVISKGVEFEPAFCDYARTCVSDLNLNQVNFINGDARFADYSLGTHFFMYTPFEGKMLQDTLQNLRGEAKKRKIKIFTYGSCTPIVARQDWLEKRCEVQSCSEELCEFLSA